jgi:hypothetical protein
LANVTMGELSAIVPSDFSTPRKTCSTSAHPRFHGLAAFGMLGLIRTVSRCRRSKEMNVLRFAYRRYRYSSVARCHQRFCLHG